MNSHKNQEPGKALLLVAILALVGGGALGYGIRAAMDRDLDIPDEAKDVPSLAVVSPVAPVRDEVAASEIHTLRTRVHELEAKLAENAREPPPAAAAPGGGPSGAEPSPSPAAGTNAPPRARRFSSPQEWMENLKKEDPERYAEMVRRGQEMRQRMKEHNQSRAEFLATLVTEKSSEALKANHEQLVATLAVVEGYQDRMGPDSENPLSEEERRAFWEANGTLRQLMEVERRGALEELGADYGEDGEAFADYIEAIYQNTNGRWPMGGPPPRGRGERGPRQGGGPR